MTPDTVYEFTENRYVFAKNNRIIGGGPTIIEFQWAIQFHITDLEKNIDFIKKISYDDYLRRLNK